MLEIEAVKMGLVPLGISDAPVNLEPFPRIAWKVSVRSRYSLKMPSFARSPLVLCLDCHLPHEPPLRGFYALYASPLQSLPRLLPWTTTPEPIPPLTSRRPTSEVPPLGSIAGQGVRYPTSMRNECHGLHQGGR